MPLIRAQVEVAADSTKPEDKFVLTPWFNQGGVAEAGGTDWAGLANDLATGISNWLVSPASREVRVKLYNMDDPAPPHFPQADVVKNTGLAPASPYPRELAVCLSFYAQRNLPRQRGRLYVPAALINVSPVAARPTSSHMSRVAALVPVLSGLGGVDIDWVVYSRMDRTRRTVTNWYVDDEWDQQRRRGLVATTRQAGTLAGG